MHNLKLEQKYINFINQQISDMIPDVDIYIFGSRTQDKSLKYSDVDIALKSTCVIDINTILKIKVFFHDSTFPYKVDIIDLNAIDKNFYNIIKNDLIKIN